MSRNDQTGGSLSQEIDAFFGRGTHGNRSPEDLEKRAKANFELWKTEILGNQANTAKFKSKLSPSQLSSHQVLEEWMSWRSQSKCFEDAAVEAIKWTQSLSSTAQSPHSYQASIASLWNCEFIYPNDSVFNSLREARRTIALQFSSCQRIASCYKSISISSTGEFALEIQARFRDRPQFGACLTPCPWLTPKQGLPYYLWDVERKGTRRTIDIIAEIGHNPKYVAISHTWGRWRRCEERFPWVSIPHVPWKIPQNSKFEVQELPDILAQPGYEYVWFDLLTIPQEEVSPEMLQLQKVEIARQAVIFQNADKSIAWLNDIKSWNAVTASLQWLCLAFLKYCGTVEEGNEMIDQLLENLFDQADTPTELSIEAISSTSAPTRSVNPWFTSLWTLQETCLRPDMLLSKNDFETLQVWKCVPLTLVEIISLFAATSDILRSPTMVVPSGVRELDTLFRQARMLGLFHLSQTSIMTMGNQRECEHRRAEAIMSAIGMTDWFKTSAEEQRDENLVFKLYPNAFVAEVREKLGSASFFSATPVGREFNAVLRKFCSHDEGYSGAADAVGSMLPFGLGVEAIRLDSELKYHAMEQEAVKTWVTENSGMVRITEAGVIASSNDTGSIVDWYCQFLAAPSAESEWGIVQVKHNANLHDLLRSYKPKMPNYAICLLHSPIFMRGIILKEIRTGVLIKVGDFWGTEQLGSFDVKSRPVSWLVL